MGQLRDVIDPLQPVLSLMTTYDIGLLLLPTSSIDLLIPSLTSNDLSDILHQSNYHQLPDTLHPPFTSLSLCTIYSFMPLWNQPVSLILPTQRFYSIHCWYWSQSDGNLAQYLQGSMPFIVSSADFRSNPGHMFGQRFVPGCPVVFRACFPQIKRIYSKVLNKYHPSNKHLSDEERNQSSPWWHHGLDWNKSSHEANTHPNNFSPPSQEPQFSNFSQESSTSTAFRRKATTHPPNK